MLFEKELKFYESIKSDLLKHHKDKFVLIKGESLTGTFTKMEEAYEEGVKQYGSDPFFVKRITEDEPIESIPSLMTGAISAHI